MEIQEPDKVVFKDTFHKARFLAYGVVKSIYDTPELTPKDMFVVWHCKTLQNWKTILSAFFEGAPLIEVTCNGDKKETYVDVYKKLENVRIPD